MDDSTFSKIIRGDIPSYKIYEDERTFVFLDIHPITNGHVLVVPKTQVEFLWDLDEENYRAVAETAKKIALHLRSVLGVPYIGEKVIGVDVPHAHIHLIPFSQSKEFDMTPNMDNEPDHERLATLAAKLAL